MSSFPEGFLWGASTAGHQIEGNNTLSDHWALENVPGSPFVEPSGDACDSYHRYAEDIALLAASGLNSYRFSVEWARIEPEPGMFSRAELDHYLRMVKACHGAGVTPVVTLNHFAVPGWFARDGAWNNTEAPDVFARYCATVAQHFGASVTWYCTLNEPNLGALLTMGGLVPMAAMEDLGVVERRDPEVQRAFATRLGGDPAIAEFAGSIRVATAEAIATIIEAHRRARAAVHRVRPSAKVGLTLSMPDFQAAEGGEQLVRDLQEAGFGPFLRAARDDDFIGVQAYTRQVLGPQGPILVAEDVPKSQTGWEVYPQALANCVRRAADAAQVPVLVTENGIATADDTERIAHTAAALQGLRNCVEDGVDILGYLHWTLLDNFEWFSGYGATFGLIAVDRTTFARTAKPSLAWLGEVARSKGDSLPSAQRPGL